MADQFDPLIRRSTLSVTTADAAAAASQFDADLPEQPYDVESELSAGPAVLIQ
jgi:hypothetical protein